MFPLGGCVFDLLPILISFFHLRCHCRVLFVGPEAQIWGRQPSAQGTPHCSHFSTFPIRIGCKPPREKLWIPRTLNSGEGCTLVPRTGAGGAVLVKCDLAGSCVQRQWRGSSFHQTVGLMELMNPQTSTAPAPPERARGLCALLSSDFGEASMAAYVSGA